MDNVKTKIAIVSHSLGSGGAERFACTLSNILEQSGFDVHHIIVNDVVDYSFSGTLCRLGRSNEENIGLLRKLRKGILLRRYLIDKEINIVIDNRTRNSLLRELFTVWIYGNRRLFFMVHSYNLRNYFPGSAFAARLLYQKAAALICVSKAIKEQVMQQYGFENTVVVYNPLQPITRIDTVDGIPEKFVLFYGRLDDEVKNFTLLLQAFQLSEIEQEGYQLVIMGDGPSKTLIKEQIEALNLQEHVRMLPFHKDPFPYVQKARFTVLTSHYEGFPMSIIESLSLGTPVVSVDCHSGPGEILIHEKNGLLVPNYNAQALADAMIKLVKDNALYAMCKENAAKSVSHLSLDNIAIQWAKILANH